MSTSSSTNTAPIESRKDYKDTPRGQHDYWQQEMSAATQARKTWHKQADNIVSRYLDSRKNHQYGSATGKPFRLNLFHSNVTTLKSMLYGNLPTVDVSRRYTDPQDDVARVAAAAMERLLNNDISDHGEDYNAVLRSVLEDRLLGGLGCARVRYEVETNEDGSQVTREAAPLDYFYWRDVNWGWARNFNDIPWIGFRVYMTEDEVKHRFPKADTDDMQFKQQRKKGKESEQDDDKSSQGAWAKTEVWEIWDKQTRKVVYYNQHSTRLLEQKDDPLQLSGFFPTPPFFMANPTTTLYAPTPDYHLAQDLYMEIDTLQTRIAIITEAVKVVGVYNRGADGVQRMLKEGVENDLIPVDNWELFAEKGGIQGQVDWLPLKEITETLDKLRQLRDETISLLYQVTGMSDVLRGSGGGQYEGVGQAELKAKFGSVRVQALQDEFATFASNLLQLKAEVIAKHFDPQTIAMQANMEYSLDRELVPDAINLIKQPERARLRIAIRPESVAMVDYAQLKNERTEYINALAVFMQSSAPLIEQDPTAKPFLLQLLQWGLAGFKGASEIEGVIDKAIEQAQQQAKQGEEKPDPEQQKMEMAQQLQQAKMEGEMQKIQAKAQADQQMREYDMQADIQTAQAEHQAKMAEIDAELQATLTEVRAKMQADMRTEEHQSQANALQAVAQAQAEAQKTATNSNLEIQKEAAKSALKIKEIEAGAAAKSTEAPKSE